MLKTKIANTQDNNVVCIVPTHNRVELLKNVLDLLKRQTLPPATLVIVDDGSTDGTKQYLSRLTQKNIIVICGDGNLWWGGAVAKGIEYVMKNISSARYVLLLNDDSIFEENYIEEMVKDSERYHGAAVVSPQYQVGGKEVVYTGYRLKFEKLEFVRTDRKKIDATVGRGLLIPISIVKRVGNINYRLFPHYVGDLEYTARIKEKGFPLVVSDNGRMYSDLKDSDINVRKRGTLISWLHPRSKVNIRDRLLFFMVRGPWLYRLTAMPKIIYRAIRRAAREIVSLW